MYLAIMASLENPVPPIGYGGSERRVDIIVRQLVGKGHKVDLYAGPGSTSPATELFLSNSCSMSKERAMAVKAWENRSRYDCIIDITAFHHVGQASYLKSVSIMAGDPFKKYPHNEVKNRIYASQELADFYGCSSHPVLYNIVHACPETIPFGKGLGKYVLYFGTIQEMKGLNFAAEACYKLDKSIGMLGRNIVIIKVS